ncbi:MAG TPA: ABC transporter ATP-binding protein [Candidatus Binatia bacterium]|nr:ABC transporter ATP-binding protein [Candidatus Binatia bacterium]
MRRLWTYLVRYRARAIAGCLCIVATASLAMAIPSLLKHAVDSIDPARAGGGLRSAGFYAGLVIAIALVQAVVRTFSRFLIFNVGRDIEYDLRNDLFAHLEHLPAQFYLTRPTGDLMSRLVNDIGAVRMMLGPGILNLLNTPVYYLYAVTIMASIDPWLTVAALLPYPIMLLVVKRYSRRLMEGTLRVQEGLADMSSRIQENVSGIQVVKAYAREDIEVREFSEMNARFRRASLELGRVRGMLAPVFRSVSALGILVVLWYGGARVATGKLTIGDLVAFIGYLHLLAWPTMALGWMLSIVQRGRAALRRLDEIFAAEAEIADPARVDGEPALAAVGRGEIELAGVSFAYPSAPTRPVLRDVDVRIPAGATVAIVGRAGSGKTSLLRLLPRLFDPTEGVVRIDGRDVRDIPLEMLRRAIAFVPQDPFLFSTSLRANIAFARPEAAGNGAIVGAGDGAASEPVRRAAEWAAVAADIDDFPRRYGTMVGERGITLSGGQKQRVTLARALLVDDAPILILDDALSSVDTQTEKQILEALEERRRGRTCLIVAHRLSTVQDADLILVLDGGRIVERGDHDSLLRAGGLYAELFQRQQISEELEAI